MDAKNDGRAATNDRRQTISSRNARSSAVAVLNTELRRRGDSDGNAVGATEKRRSHRMECAVTSGQR